MDNEEEEEKVQIMISNLKEKTKQNNKGLGLSFLLQVDTAGRSPEFSPGFHICPHKGQTYILLSNPP